jgi:hypothetical protein
MLYNPSWSEPFTMPHFVAWMERHPREETYNYQNCEGCLVAQYYREHNGLYESPSSDMISENGGGWPTSFPGTEAPFLRQAEWIARGATLWPVREWSFGHALDRALEHTQAQAIA